MQNRHMAMLAIVVVLSGTTASYAQFDSGSDGSYGPIEVTEDTTLVMPPDGVFNATTVNVAEGATLSFIRNGLNTPVYILATGDINIEGTIDVSGNDLTGIAGGQGGPGGFSGGNGGSGSLLSAWGRGPGGGPPDISSESCSVSSPGGGSFASKGGCDNVDRSYGSSLLLPMIGGSGGGGDTGVGGGGGGGAILMASSTRIDLNGLGTVDASGGLGINSSSGGNGSGGAIRLLATIVAGDGSLKARDGDNDSTLGLGRVRIDTLDSSNMNFDIDGAGAVGANMFVFLNVQPRLDIIEVAGEKIPEGTTESFVFLLPFGSATMQTITVQARDFTGVVPITIALVPENGERQFFDIEIDMSSGNPASVQTTVDFTADATHIQVWTR